MKKEYEKIVAAAKKLQAAHAKVTTLENECTKLRKAFLERWPESLHAIAIDDDTILVRHAQTFIAREFLDARK